MRRLTTLLVALLVSPALIVGATARGSDSASGDSGMPIGMCHQYCAFANTQLTGFAQRRTPREPAAQARSVGVGVGSSSQSLPTRAFSPVHRGAEPS